MREAAETARIAWEAASKRLSAARARWMMATSRGIFAARRRLREAEEEERLARVAYDEAATGEATQGR